MKLLQSMKVEEKESSVRHREQCSFYHGGRRRGWLSKEFWRRGGVPSRLLEESTMVEIGTHLSAVRFDQHLGASNTKLRSVQFYFILSKQKSFS